MSVNYREPQWLLPNEKNLQYPAAGATQGSGLTADRHSLYSMDFDGSNDYVDTTLDIDANSNFSISFWFNWDQDQKVIITDGSFDAWSSIGYGFQIMSNGSVSFLVGDNGASTGKTISSTAGSISVNTWNHIVGVCDLSNEIRLYLNGISVDNTAVGSSRNETSNNLRIAGDYSSTKRLFNGQIDELAIFSRALSSNEVTTLYNSGSPSNPMLLSGKPVAYYPLGEQARKPGTVEWRFPNEVLQGQAIDFDGTDYIELDNSNGNYNFDNISISAWFHPNSTGTKGAIISNTHLGSGWMSYSVNHWTDNRICVLLRTSGNNQVFSSNTVNLNQWNHIAFFWDGTTAKIYLNNVLTTPTVSSGNISSYSTNNVEIGKRVGFSQYLDGKLSNIAIWDTDQSANITNIYNYGAPQTSYTVTPTAWYKLDKTSEYAGLNPNWHNALSLGGTDYIDCGVISAVEGVSTFSMAAWVYPTNGALKAAIGNWGNPYIGVSIDISSSAVYFVVDSDAAGSGYGTTSSGLTNNTWNHVMLVFDGSGSTDADKLKGYINGIEHSLSYTGTIPATTATPNRSFRIGDAHVGNGLIGNISNAAIWNQAISSEDVKYLYNGGTPQTNISFEPTSWWKLDNLTTGIQDSGSASNNGTNNGATAVSSSVAVDQWNFDNAVQSQTPNWSSALSFDGSSSYIDCGTISSFDDGDISFALWCNLTSNGTYQYILSSSNSGSVSGINIAVDSSGNLVFQRAQDVANTQNSTGYAVTGFSYGNWHHLCGTYNATSGELKAYIDGNLKSTTNDSADTRSASTALKIGGLSNDSLYPANGQISNVAIFNTTLDSAAVTALYNNGQPETAISSSPVSWWKLDNTTTGIQDSGSASNNGTNNGATEIQTNVWTPRLNGESDTLPSTALVSSDLQFNSAYSSFSLDFDGSNDYIETSSIDVTGVKSFSFWLKRNSTTTNDGAVMTFVNSGKTDDYMAIGLWNGSADTGALLNAVTDNAGNTVKSSSSEIPSDVWIHFVVVKSATAITAMYINGVSETMDSGGMYYANATAPQSYLVRANFSGLNLYANINLSNVSVFNKALNQAEVTSIYNNGYPKDITALAPVSWWRLGEDTYFDGTNFTVPNQITTGPNGTSANMTATDLVADAPGSYASGIGSSLGLSDRVGDAALSTANSLSFNMTPENRISYPAGYTPTQADNIYSMAFDGVNDYIDAGNDSSLQITGNLSISAWFKVDNSSLNTYFNIVTKWISSDAAWSSYVTKSTGILSFWISTNGSTQLQIHSTTNVNDGNWHHFAGVNDGTNTRLYIDGNLEDTGTGGAIYNSTQNVLIGKTNQNSFLFSGNIDEVAIFDYALSARQIKQDIYNGTTSGKTADLNNISNLTAPVAWYRMGD